MDGSSLRPHGDTNPITRRISLVPGLPFRRKRAANFPERYAFCRSYTGLVFSATVFGIPSASSFGTVSPNESIGNSVGHHVIMLSLSFSFFLPNIPMTLSLSRLSSDLMMVWTSERSLETSARDAPISRCGQRALLIITGESVHAVSRKLWETRTIASASGWRERKGSIKGRDKLLFAVISARVN